MGKCIFLYGESLQLHLLKTAIKFAELGYRTWFFAPKPFEELPAGLPFPSKEVLQLITFFYLNKNETIRKLRDIYFLKNVPPLIVIFEIEAYLEEDISKSAFFMASIKALIEFCTKKLGREAYFLAGLCSQDCEYEVPIQRMVNNYFDDVVDTKLIFKLHDAIPFL